MATLEELTAEVARLRGVLEGFIKDAQSRKLVQRVDQIEKALKKKKGADGKKTDHGHDHGHGK